MSLLWAYRRATWRRRSLPELLIIGAQKSGTTSLFHYLSQHPQLFPSYTKEVHFFDGGLDPDVDDYAKGEAWYRAHFPVGKPPRKAFEASPLYLYHPEAPGRMSALVPEARLVAILRNPTSRAISHFNHEERKGHEPLALDEALRAEESRLSTGGHAALVHCSYKSRGRYAEQLERYYEHFPRENVLVLTTDELADRPQATLERVFDHVGVEAGFEVKDLKRRHVGGKQTDLDPGIRARLDDYFRPHNQALHELVGRNLGW